MQTLCGWLGKGLEVARKVVNNMIKMIPMNHRWVIGDIEDCIVIRKLQNNYVELSFPFHEDTPNFTLSQSEGYTLQKALEEIVDVKFLGK